MEGMTLEKLQVIIEAYTKPYRDELDKVKQKTGTVASQVEKQTSKISHSFKKVGKAVAAVLSITAILAFGKSCIQLGSDLTEVQNVVDVTFGDMNKQVDAFSKNAITQFGLSELTAKKYMGTYGAMAKSFGITGEAGYQMSAAITGLTGDVASFYNLSTDAAYTKLKSIFTGETESLKELGVVMTQTALDQYAFNHGLGRTTAQMTEQEKVMLRYRFVMDSLADAQGDFSRTSNSWANQVRVLSLQFESLKATIGQGLINVFTPVIRVINIVLAKLQTLASYFKAFTTALFGDASGGSAVSSAADSMASVAGSSGAVADNMNNAAGAAKKMKEYTLGIDELNVLNPDEGESGSGGGSGGGGGTGGVPDFGSMGGELFGDVTVNPAIEEAVNKLKETLERLKEAAKPTTDALKRLWNEGLALLGKFTWTALKDFWDYFLVPVGTWALGEGLPAFFDITNKLLKEINWETLNESLKNLWKALEPFAENIGRGLLWFYDYVLVPIATWTINDVLISFLSELTDILNSLNYYIEKVKPAFDWLEEKLEYLNNKFQDNRLNDGISKINGFLERLGIKIELPSLEEFFSDKAVDNAWRSVDAFDVIMTFSDSMKGLEGLETWWNDHISPYLDLDEWKKKTSVINTSIAIAVFVFVLYWKEKLSEWWTQDVVPWFTIERWSKVYESIGSALKSKWDSTVGTWIADIQNWWHVNVAPWFTTKRWGDLYQTVKEQLKKKWNETATVWISGISQWWTQNVAPWFTVQKWSDLYEAVKAQLKVKWDATVGTWSTDISNWWNKNVAPWFTVQKWTGLYESIKSSMKTKWNETVGNWKTDISNWWNHDVITWFTLEKWSGIMKGIPNAFRDVFKNSVNAAVAQLNRLIDWINDHLHFDFDGIEIMGEEIVPSFSVQLFTIPHIPTFASGGLVSSGQLFIANEAGPEIVGKYGNKTGVMNNRQIVDAVSEGVALAVADVMSGFQNRDSGEPVTINLVVDGRTLATVSNNTKKRSGFNFRPA